MNRHAYRIVGKRMKPVGRFPIDNRGISLTEILICAGILVVVLTGLFRLFIYSTELNDMSRNITVAMSEVQGKVEEIRNYNFNLLTTDYVSGGTPGDKFALSQVTGMGVIAIDASNSKLLGIRIVACWRNQNGRVIGEDQNLNGTLDTGEDLNGNGAIDSPAVIETYVPRL